MPQEPTELVRDLTEPQRRAVLHVDGPLLVLAAAGSGKTRVITRRVARLVALGIPGWSILALTFTNKAAGEMRDRVNALLGEGSRASRGLTLTTFHALGARLLRKYAPLGAVPGLKGDFTIYDASDQQALVKKVLEGLQMSAGNWSPRSVLSAISAAKNDLLDAAAYARSAGGYYEQQIARVFESYERALRAAGAVDFDDLLVLTARMLRTDARVRAEVQARWRYLLIDEYQDTNRAQFEIARLIAGEGAQSGGPALPAELEPAGPNICVVGDPDQAIYGWRGADIENILDFEKHYPGAEVIALGENFRSTAPILGAADSLIRRNRRRKHKDLFTSRPGGDPVEIVVTQDEHHEARVVCDWLRSHSLAETAGGLAWRDMAVFYRTNALSRVIEEQLRSGGIPYVIARGTAFYEREEVRNALAYLRVIANQADDISLLRIINTPARGIGKASLDRVIEAATARGLPVFSLLREPGTVKDLSARACSAVRAFVALIDGLTGHGAFMGADVPASLAELVERAIRDSGLEALYRQQAGASGAASDEDRLANLSELVSSAAEFEQKYDPASDPALDGAGASTPPLLAMLRAYLESVALVADADTVDPERGSVTLMTLHAAKGLEFRAVAMIGLEEGLLPHARSLENEHAMEEERRLCFVGITRAMRRLLITHAKYRSARGFAERTMPSRFLDELPPEHCTRRDLARDGFIDDGPEAAPAPSAGRGRDSGPPGPFPPGSLVRHPQFGVGKVLAVSRGPGARARVEFREAGVKTLVLEYAGLKQVGEARGRA
ncbi:MAG: UvrD-helicase domain-containing protein [Phycisphaerales bacterium]|nr:UvrD-helicase domain-containing protein [Phycisphaerales bacterium]